MRDPPTLPLALADLHPAVPTSSTTTQASSPPPHLRLSRAFRLPLTSSLLVGGRKILFNMNGKDATEKFWQFHGKKVLEKTAQPFLVGRIGGAEEEKEGKDLEEAVVEKVEEELAEEEVDEDVYGDLVPFGGASNSFRLPLLLSADCSRSFTDPQWYQDWASPYYNDTHRRVRSAVRKYTGSSSFPPSRL